jgi:hypothetical protein
MLPWGDKIELVLNSFYWWVGGLNLWNLFAMLGQQVWKLILQKKEWKLVTISSSLLTGVLKDKYFSRSGFLEDNHDSSPSYT